MRFAGMALAATGTLLIIFVFGYSAKLQNDVDSAERTYRTGTHDVTYVHQSRPGVSPEMWSGHVEADRYPVQVAKQSLEDFKVIAVKLWAAAIGFSLLGLVLLGSWTYAGNRNGKDALDRPPLQDKKAMEIEKQETINGSES
jgi:hypothetical protein